MMESQPGMTVDTMLEQLIDKLLGETDWKDKLDDACKVWSADVKMKIADENATFQCVPQPLNHLLWAMDYRVICDMYTKYPSTKCGSTLTQPNIVLEAMDLLMEEHDRASMCDYGTWEEMLNVGRVALK